VVTNKDLFSNPLITKLPQAEKEVIRKSHQSLVSDNPCNTTNALQTKEELLKDGRNSPEIIIGSLFDAKGNSKFKN